MSCTPTSHIELSLSPGDESRFVPHPSILGPASSSVLEKHFGARMTDVERKEPVLVEEEGGIVGATICFTPQSSPGVSPRVERLERGGDAKNYVGELNVGSSNMRIASSLDNRSITEYELLDEIESRERSVEVEDLDLTEDVDDPVESATGNLARREHERENVTLGGSLGSIPDSLPSLTPFRRIEPLPQDPPETPRLTKESLFRNLEYSDEATAFSRMTKSMLSRMSKSGKLNVDNVEPDGDLSNASSSPKVDDTPMRTLKNLRAFWESRVLAKDAEDTEEVKNEELTENRSAQQELDASDSIGSNFQDSGMSSQAFSPRKTLSSFLSVIQVCVSLWVLRLAFRCALNFKKILEKICDGLANNISSTTATRVDPLDDSTKNVNLDETDVDKNDDSTSSPQRLISFHRGGGDDSVFAKERDDLRHSLQDARRELASLKLQAALRDEDNEDEKKKLRGMVEDLRSRLTKAEENLNQEAQGSMKNNRELEECRTKIHDLEDQNASLADELDVAKSKALQLKKAEAALAAYRKKLESMGSIDQDVTSLQVQTEGYLRKIVELENENKKIPALQKYLEEAQSQAKKLETRYNEADDLLKAKDAEMLKLRNAASTAENAKKMYQEELNELRAQHESAAEISSPMASLSINKSGLSKARKNAIRLEIENFNLKAQIEELQAKEGDSAGSGYGSLDKHLAEKDEEIAKLQQEKEKLEHYTKKTLQNIREKYLVALQDCEAKLKEKHDKIVALEMRNANEKVAHKREMRLLSSAIFELGLRL